ncbi:MAG TPA: DUF2934 domain-containing protein [Terriglobales bacterium]|jgi:hypothetical protein|nr:DUF2934 domain-containing protein [Terriglobales bacterium]
MANTAHPDHSMRKPSSKVVDLQEAIRRRAEEIYVRSGKQPGRDVQNWIQAEQEVLQESQLPQATSPQATTRQTTRTAVVVNVNGVQYTGEYTPDIADGYMPGEFDRGDPVPVHFAGDKMFLTRPNGRELETTIVGTVMAESARR